MTWRPPAFDMEAHMRERALREDGIRKSEAEYKILASRDPRGPRWLRFHVWFLMFTSCYVLIASRNLGPFGIPNSDGAGNLFGNLIGLFVPIGPNNYIFFLIHPLGWLALALVALVVWRTNRLLESNRPSGLEKIYWNLTILIVLTAVTDFLTIGWWASMGVFLHSLGITS